MVIVALVVLVVIMVVLTVVIAVVVVVVVVVVVEKMLVAPLWSLFTRRSLWIRCVSSIF